MDITAPKRKHGPRLKRSRVIFDWCLRWIATVVSGVRGTIAANALTPGARRGAKGHPPIACRVFLAQPFSHDKEGNTQATKSDSPETVKVWIRVSASRLSTRGG